MEKCPKCQEPQFPQGSYIVVKDVKLNTHVSILFLKLPVRVKATFRYCPKCGYLAVQDIGTF